MVEIESMLVIKGGKMKIFISTLLLSLIIFYGCDCYDDYSQREADEDTLAGIVYGLVDVYNQNLAGNPTGYVNYKDKLCPLGGKVTITGRATYAPDVDLYSDDLIFSMEDCTVQWVPTSQSSMILTLSGDISMKGSHGKGGTYQSTVMNSEELHIEGTLQRKGYNDKKVKATCEVQINWQVQDGRHTIGGTICGRKVSTLFPKPGY